MNQARELSTPSPERGSRNLRDRERGQGFVEFALILPGLLLLILGIIEFGRLMVTYSSVSSASRDAARYGSAVGEYGVGIAPYQNCTAIRKIVTDRALFVVPAIDLSYDLDGHGVGAAVPYCVGLSEDEIDVVQGTQIIVKVTANYQPLVPIVKLPVLPVIGESRRSIVMAVYIK